MKLHISSERGVQIQPDMIGLFFEDINYAADGGLYAEMIENRSFEFVEAFGDAKDYYTTYDGGYGWSPYPMESVVKMQPVMGSPLTEENPHYMRITALENGAGISNQGFDGISLKKGMNYHVYFWCRCVKYQGNFTLKVVKDNQVYAQASVAASEGTQETYNFFRRYEVELTATEDIRGARLVFALAEVGTVELDFISMMPADAVEGIFRRDLYEKLAGLKPGFLRFPGGCIVEGNTLANRYRYKDSLKPVWARENNWNRWAVHGNNEENNWHGPYSHYNQSLGLGYYEYFLLCEKIGAKAIPVMNVGFACQYQSIEQIEVDSPGWQEFVQDALDLIEFANGDATTKWGQVRAQMGHEAPFNLTMLGIGNEQWETERADFFKRYEIFEREIHARYPEIRLIGSAGPDITSERYEKAWRFYNEHKAQENFVYAVDEHYYVKPQWLFEHVDFYDNYDRMIKVFSGEYAAHPTSGMNKPEANTLEGALAEAAFLTGVERNADVVVLASYAPLFAKLGYAQWSPDMIWFDAESSYGSPSYYVQKLYAGAVGDVTLVTGEECATAREDKLYYSLSYKDSTKEIIIKIVNANEEERELDIVPDEAWKLLAEDYSVEILTGPCADAYNSIENPENVSVRETAGKVAERLTLPALSFNVIRMKAEIREKKNPWEEIALSDYENHMKLDSVMQLQAMNAMMKEQFNQFNVKTAMVLGVAGGNGLEHTDNQKIKKVYGVDINREYLKECALRYTDLKDVLEYICEDLTAGNVELPHVDLVIANLLIEYIGYECFQHVIQQIEPAYVSCVIQINMNDSFVSDSPYLHVFDGLNSVHHQMQEDKLIDAMKMIEYCLLGKSEQEMPNGKKLVKLDFESK